MMEKLKGFVKIERLQNILHDAPDVERDPKTGDIHYWTGKNLFVARRKNVKYWEVFHVKGV